MITVYPYDSLGHVHHGWLNARHHFSFASYQNPERRRFGNLHVINDDVIQAGAGFDTHPHHDMEIITYVRSGAITHKDSHGNEGRTEAGDVQVMSAGSGIEHSEFNLESVDTNLYQIWIYPHTLDVAPRWEAKRFPHEPITDHLPLLVSGDAEDNVLFIYQDARIYGGRLIAGTQIDHPIKHQAYLLVSDGNIMVNDTPLSKGDGAEVVDHNSLSLQATTDAELLVIDVSAV